MVLVRINLIIGFELNPVWEEKYLVEKRNIPMFNPIFRLETRHKDLKSTNKDQKGRLKFFRR